MATISGTAGETSTGTVVAGTPETPQQLIEVTRRFSQAVTGIGELYQLMTAFQRDGSSANVRRLGRRLQQTIAEREAREAQEARIVHQNNG